MTEKELECIEAELRRLRPLVSGQHDQGTYDLAKTQLALLVHDHGLDLVAEVRRLRAQRDAWIEFADALHKGDNARLAAAGAAIAKAGMSEPMCRQCRTKPIAYPGAVFCGAACCALADS